jgi:alkyl hydroperoxide reductase subunit AhpC
MSDVSKKISKDYGCLSSDGKAFRATYIIDEKGILRHSFINDMQVGRDVSEFFRLVQAF